ncbi:hypothetical protein C5B85_16770 [Pseudoclavibacter sp. AY1F1]|uniref:acyltransferase family protein n=1 Tax=Pseudoclavibacter sp. AY1F1 TaxID=2080583 RepID=UPI000CE89962|nr:acyltransferase family protein [Pseudoclavibacter sp. AY1F1]PPF42412.1 hypothetical protein C5B85_16770 [Pseudoclavibacter sp. AY1F1]
MPNLVERPTGTSPRVSWVDTARGISILLVVVLHATLWLGYISEPPRWLVVFNEVAGFFRMPLFFAAAGLFAQKWMRARWRELFRGKLWLLIWVYLAWQPAFFAFKFAVGQVLPDQRDASLAAHLLRAVVSPLRPQGELWFLWALVLFFLIARLLRSLPRVLHVGLAAAGALLWLHAVLPALGDSTVRLLGVGVVSAPYLYLFFVLGLLGRREIEVLAAALERHRWLPIVVFLTFVPVALLVVSSGAQSDGATMLGMRVVGLVFGVALSVMLARVAALPYLGARTLQIYVAHMPIIATAVILLSLAGVSIQEPAVFAGGVVVLVAAAVLISLGMKDLAAKNLGRLLYEPLRPWHASARPFAGRGGR